MNYAKPHYSSQDTTPRQRRLQAERRFFIARFHEHVGIILGALILGAGILALFFFC